ncbi:MAG TPA: DHA2 family efflux MFS transporter permease subunit [Acidimicrobiales bacterium]|nr:DHA2 family efflux MFS transporter permease subunit [Acidimicrobiales bacterium]
MTDAVAGTLRAGTSAGRWVVVATVLGSGMAFLDGTVVNVALPAIGRDLHSGLAGLQWTLDAYLLTLGALLLLGGSLGDRYGRRRVYVVGLIAFSCASALCGLAPTLGALIAARAVQGVGGALLVPGSLALLSASFAPEDRGRAVGAWSGLAGAFSALGPFLGGWLVDAVSWRFVFLINLPVAVITVWVVLAHVPESRDPGAASGGRLDVPGALAATVGLAGVVFALIQGSANGVTPLVAGAAVVGVAALVAFPFIERGEAEPLVPLEIFRSHQFSGANATTFAVYGAFNGALFLFVVELQRGMGYSALEAGSAMLPVTLLMLTLSSRAGRLSQRMGPRLPMTVGPAVAGGGLLLLGQVGPGTHYLTGVLPAVIVFGLGLALTVAPLTAAVMAAVEERHLGVGSGVNNAVARVAGLLSVALLPLAAGLSGVDPGAPGFPAGVRTALRISAVVCVVGGGVAFTSVRRSVAARAVVHPSMSQACADPVVVR